MRSYSSEVVNTDKLDELEKRVNNNTNDVYQALTAETTELKTEVDKHLVYILLLTAVQVGVIIAVFYYTWLS